MAVPRKLSRGKRTIFALVNVLFVLVIIEGGARLADRHRPGEERTYPSLDAYREEQRGQARTPHGFRANPRIWRRVARRTPGARMYPDEGGYFVELDPEQLPADRRAVLIFGGSAAYGLGIDWPLTYTHLLGQALQDAPGGVELVNLARPGWELDSQVEVLRQVIPRLRRPPAAVVIYAGNNEVPESWRPPRIGRRPWESLAIYRVLRRWLRPTRRLERHFDDDLHPDKLLAGTWLPEGGLSDASFWLAERRDYLDSFGRALEGAVRWLGQRKIPVVLVAVPVNLDFFNGRLVPQPLTYRAIAPGAQRALADRLRQALGRSGGGRLEALRALVKAEPSGVVQRWALGRQLDTQGGADEARDQLSRARDAAWGYGGALPSIARRTLELAGPGVRVIDTRSWYGGAEPIQAQARGLFIDACHLSRAGHRRLANDLTPVLRALLAE